MKLGDYSPPAFSSPDQQRDALQKGLGRAVQWALNGRLDEELLLEACLRDQRFDWQIESSRGDWLWRMVRAIGAADRFRVPILHALYDLSDEHNAVQLCELARCYAERGDQAFRTRLYEIVAQKPFPAIPWLGDEEIIELDGEQAVLFVARVRGRQLADREWECDDGSFIDFAIERCGAEGVNKLLEESSEEAVSRFRESWLHDKGKKAEQRQHPSQRERMAATSVDEILRAAEGESKCYWLRGWGRQADEADLRIVLHRLWSATEPAVIANLLKAFAARALPEFDARLIELCRHPDDEVCRRAFRALGQNTHPLIRQFALTELEGGVRDGSVIDLFVNNYQQGDEHRILEAMEFPDDACELHWLLMAVIKVLEENPEADCSRLGVLGYASTPCAECRFDAAQLLHQQQVAPKWLKEECRFDSGEDCRKLVEKTSGLTERAE